MPKGAVCAAHRWYGWKRPTELHPEMSCSSANSLVEMSYGAVKSARGVFCRGVFMGGRRIHLA